MSRRRIVAPLMPVLLLLAASAGADDPSESPRPTLRGFSDVDYLVNQEGLPDTFALGQLDLFLTSSLAKDLSVLAEIVFEFGEDNQAVLDVERLQLKWAPSDAFALAVGRLHTPLGYWNQYFHHGAWFQTTATRPDLYLFEDDGGILPVHEIGLEASGTARFKPFDLGYSVSLVNGRGRVPDEISNVQDLNGNKAVNLLLSVAPNGVPGLKFGANTYIDTIPPDPDGGRPGELDEWILGGFAVYVQQHVELLAEGSHIRHEDDLGRKFDTFGFYVQGSCGLGRFRPYYRFDRVDVAEGDPFLPPKDLAKHTVGLRFDPVFWLGLKGEYGLSRFHGGDDVSSGQFQAAFTF